MLSIRKSLLAASAAAAISAGPAWAAAPYQHVLLISVDGMHAVDLQTYVSTNPKSTLAKLSSRGLTFQQAYTTAPSDSFPGMLAQVTGATSLSTGVFYDDAYDRTLFAAGSNCAGNPGTETNLSEALDKSTADVTAGGTLGKPRTQIDVTKLPLALKNGACVPMYPHEFVRVNTLFEVVKAAGMRSAWSDKHPAYDILNGPSGNGVDDLYTPEINSNNILGGAGDNTQSFNAVSAYDQTKVNAILHEIDGLDSIGKNVVGVPAVFGMNFQSVSVGQKLAVSGPTDPAGLVGGYTDAVGTPGNALTQELNFVDGALGQMVAELQAKGLYDNTLIIVSAKHGQSPIDVSVRTTRDDGAFFPQTPGYGFHIADDVLLLWLDPSQRATQLAAATAYLQSIAPAANIQTLLGYKELKTMYKNPMVDSRTPDFIGLVYHGTIYTGGSKLAEHGGFADDDRHVGLLVSGKGLASYGIAATPVTTTQIAPTILKALGLSPSALQGVVLEHTKVLPKTIG